MPENVEDWCVDCLCETGQNGQIVVEEADLHRSQPQCLVRMPDHRIYHVADEIEGDEHGKRFEDFSRVCHHIYERMKFFVNFLSPKHEANSTGRAAVNG
jgi:hypothetical protein